MSLFQIGEGFVVLLAGLRSTPRDLFDAGSVDGGSGLQLFRFITLPLLLPWLVLLTFRDVIVAFQYTFTPAMTMTGGDPYFSTLFLPQLIYEEAFDRFRFGPGSALMLVMLAVSGLLIVALYALVRRRGLVDDA
jgi:ABC-type sugar transport system permease subunit